MTRLATVVQFVGGIDGLVVLLGGLLDLLPSRRTGSRLLGDARSRCRSRSVRSGAGAGSTLAVVGLVGGLDAVVVRLDGLGEGAQGGPEGGAGGASRHFSGCGCEDLWLAGYSSG